MKFLLLAAALPLASCAVHIDTLFRSPEWIEIPRGARHVEALRRQAALTALGDWLITHPVCSARPGDGTEGTP